MGKIFKEKRVIHGISKQSSIFNENIQKIINNAIKYTSYFWDFQNIGVLLLLGEDHNKVWDITKETLRKKVSAENFSFTEEKINSLRNAYGTMLFFEDKSAIEESESQIVIHNVNLSISHRKYLDILELVLNTASENESQGALLQHYNYFIDGEIQKEWDVPDSWKLIVQMPFGKPQENYFKST